MRRLLCYIVLVLALAACHRGPVGPQRPANKEGQTQRDSALMTMLRLNERMASEADREVLRYVQADTLHRYAQCPQGAWVARTTALPDQQPPKMGEPVEIAMRIFSLRGELLRDVEGEFTIGKGELPLGIEYAIRELRRGESGIILAPWHAAFGVDGDENIGPYTNVRIELTIH